MEPAIRNSAPRKRQTRECREGSNGQPKRKNCYSQRRNCGQIPKFLVTEVRSILKILSLNVHGNVKALKTNKDTIQWFNEHDIVALYELKCDANLNIPGFRSLRSIRCKGQENRGGTLVLIKWRYNDYIYNITQMEDQVWFKLTCFPNTILGACYIPPHDSTYFRVESFANIQEMCQTNEEVVIFGDLNARMGKLSKFNSNIVTYSPNPDNTINSHGRDLAGLCEINSLSPINHAVINTQSGKQVACEGGFTFRQK